jgi:hypothetical protein
MKQAVVAVGLVLLLLLVGCVTGPRMKLLVSGSIDRDLSQAQVFYEDSPGGRQLYVHQMGPGQDMLVLDVALPADLVPGTYAVSPAGPITATYYEYVDGVSRRFDVDVQGTLVVSQVDDRFSGELALSAFTTGSQAQSIAVTGSFSGIPYNRAGLQATRVAGTLAALVLVAAFVVLLVANFIFQFYVGRHVYGAEGTWVLASLRGTRTFIRGWRMADLRTVMAAWSLALAGLLLSFLFLLLMRF